MWTRWGGRLEEIRASLNARFCIRAPCLSPPAVQAHSGLRQFYLLQYYHEQTYSVDSRRNQVSYARLGVRMI